MDFESMQIQLRDQGQAILALGSSLSTAEARWKPSPQQWSILEVLNHLVDEEVLDFRRHLAHILETPDAPWPEIDPQGWVTGKRYNQRSLAETLENFSTERAHSQMWLDGLTNPHWEQATTLPWGDLSAGDMLASWVAHDCLHLRQPIELRYALTVARSNPYRVDYAGEW